MNLHDLMRSLSCAKKTLTLGFGIAYLAAPAVADAAVVLRVNANLHVSADSLEGSEELIAPPARPVDLAPLLADLPALDLAGENTLLVVGSKNSFKLDLLTKRVKQALAGLPGALVVLPFAAASGVNEQPYNGRGTQGAGVRGAAGRIKSALAFLQSPEGKERLAAEGIGRVIIGTVENYIELFSFSPKRQQSRPADFGVIALYNAASRSVVATLSEGVTIDPAYVLEAMGYGLGVVAPANVSFQQELNAIPELDYDHVGGHVTVGKVLERHAYGIAADDWHKLVAHSSRYTLLKIAAAQLQVPL